MKDIIPARKESPIFGLSGMGGGVGGNLVAGGSGDFKYVDDVFAPSLYLANSQGNPVQAGTNPINLGTANSGRSVYFNGFNDCLTITNTNDYQVGNNEFCLEAWVYHEGDFDSYDVIFGNWNGNESYIFETVGAGSQTELEFYFFDTSNTFHGPIQGGNLNKNTWYHIAVTRTLASGNLIYRMFIDGVMHGTGTQNNNTTRNGTSDFQIGSAGVAGDGTAGQWKGYISNLRLTVGEPVYSANFTPSTEELTTTSQGVTASNVKLLCCQGETAQSATKQTAYPYQIRAQKMGAPAPKPYGPFTSGTASDGGMVWFKQRSGTGNPNIVDTIRGGTSYSFTDTTQVGTDVGYHIKTFDAGGFTLQNGGGGSNASGNTYVGWTFKTHKKFFTQLQYTGNGVNRQIAHDLGSTPGMMLIKRVDGGGSSSNWRVYHRGNNGGTTPQNYALRLNLQDEAVASPTSWNDTAPTSTHFTVGTHEQVNYDTGTFMAYLFAHDAGGFGADDESIIKCGNYTGNSSTDGPTINLDWEPQYILIKRASGGSEHWMVYDASRQISNLSGDEFDIETSANATEREGINWMHLTSTGFKLDANSNHVNGNGNNYIYMAIRRVDGSVGKPPTEDNAQNYFHSAYSRKSTPNDKTATSTLPFAPDTCIMRQPAGTSNWLMGTRQTGRSLVNCNATNTMGDNQYWEWDYPRGWQSYTGDNTAWCTWGWKRGLSHDVVCYKGTGSLRQITHSMNAVPEMVWLKCRDNGYNWVVYHAGVNNGVNPQNYGMYLNLNNGQVEDSTWWNNTAPTKTQVTLSNSGTVNQNGFNYVMYLFSSVDGVSKCGYYDGSNSTQTITVGFQPRFVIIKKTNTSGEWVVLDTTRGWGAGNDNWLQLDSNAAQVSSNMGAPTSTGFTVNAGVGAINDGGQKYIYYAHA